MITVLIIFTHQYITISMLHVFIFMQKLLNVGLLYVLSVFFLLCGCVLCSL